MYGNSGIGVISDGGTNLSELIAMLIDEESSFERGIENVFDKVKGSCSILLLTREGLYAARDKLGRTPGEIIFMTAEGYEQRRKPNDKMQI
jgi:amidophosphoribosyltransferase